MNDGFGRSSITAKAATVSVRNVTVARSIITPRSTIEIMM
jgi:hypothetical protein